MTPDQQAPPADRLMTADDALEWLRQRLTEDNFPFFNRHPHHTTAETWAMWAERDVLAEIQAVRDALRQADEMARRDAGSKPTPTSHTACGTGNWTMGTSAQGYGGIDPDAGSKP
jgi:hypothetical protein